MNNDHDHLLLGFDGACFNGRMMCSSCWDYRQPVAAAARKVVGAITHHEWREPVGEERRQEIVADMRSLRAELEAA